MGFRRKMDRLEATKIPTDVDIAWSAGIFEGEGHTQNYKLRGRLTVRVTQKDPELLYRLRDWFGGSIVKQGVCMVWLACGDRGRYFLALVYPFLTARRRAQVDSVEALNFLNGMDPGRLSANQIATLLDSKPTKVRKKNPFGPEETKRRHRLAVAKYWSNPENREKARMRGVERIAKAKFDRISVTSTVTNLERIN